MVPTGFIAVVRDLDAFIGTPIATPNIYLHGALGQTIYWATATIGQSQINQWRGRQVYEPGELVVVHAEVGPLDAWDVTVSGYLLTITN